MSKSTIWDGFNIELAKLFNFEKQIKLFFQKTPPVFPRKTKVWTFWEFFEQKYILRRILKKYNQCEKFSKSLVSFSKWPIYFHGNLKMLKVFSSLGQLYFLKRKLGQKCNVCRFWIKIRIFSKTTSISPNKPNIRLFWEFRCNMKVWHAILIRNAKWSSWFFSRFLSQKTSLFFKKTQVLNVWRLHKQKKTFEKHSKRKYPCLVFFKTFKCFSKKNISFSKKKPEFKRLENSWAIVKIET